MTTDSQVRVRFAPSPTGYLHIGGARTALFNWLFAKHHNGTFILRIDDTDEQRSTEASMKEIYGSLKWLGLNWDEGAIVGGEHGPYVQSERGKIYQKYTQQMVENGSAYHCYCTPAELAEIRETAQAENRSPHYNRRCLNLTSTDRQRLTDEGRRPVVRFKVPDKTVVVNDRILGQITTEAETLQDEVIVKSNGSPLYNLTSVIDDHEMTITHVIRGGDHLSNTPKQILIAEALGLQVPQFAHLPMVLGSSKGEKLSKRHGATSIEQYRQDGYLPQAMVNFLVRLGWSLDDETEIFSVDELIEHFSLERVGKSGSVFDLKKLQWLNSHYISKLEISTRTDAVIPFLQREGLLDSVDPDAKRSWLEQVVATVGDRLTTLADIKVEAAYFFTDNFEYDPKGVKKWLTKGNPIGTLQSLYDGLVNIVNFDLKTVEDKIWAVIEELGIKRVAGMQPLRIALSGMTGGPSLFEMITLIGQEKVLERLQRLIEYLREREDL
ncbi:glutamate--tRNA ligase [Candidatus Poribacteria bacterium]|nr:glutamate--tRNA ligase [Candidatus Poribacteria bacterium]